MINWGTIYLTLKLAFTTTLILMFVGIGVAYFLSITRTKLKPLFLAITSLPLILPPTVLGFYLLILFSPQSAFGHFILETFGLQLIFTFEGLVLASVIYSLPFMVQPIYAGLNQLPPSLSEASIILGKGRCQTLYRILLPNISISIWTGLALTFAHTVGEFGVVLMMGGSLPGETKVASTAIFEAVETLDYSLAHRYSIILIAFALITSMLIYSFNKKDTHEA